MNKLTFIRFDREHYDLYAAWSEDEEITRWLGRPTQKWFNYVLTTTHSFTWMIYEHNVPVAHLQIDLLEDDSSQAQVTIMVAPQLRRRGYGQRVLTAMLQQAELVNVTRFYAFVKPDNIASVELLKRMGYKLVSSQPVDTGFVEYAFLRIR